jgi:23S rRNA A1618 N6-methylase RlmF
MESRVCWTAVDTSQGYTEEEPVMAEIVDLDTLCVELGCFEERYPHSRVCYAHRQIRRRLRELKNKAERDMKYRATITGFACEEGEELEIEASIGRDRRRKMLSWKDFVSRDDNGQTKFTAELEEYVKHKRLRDSIMPAINKQLRKAGWQLVK